MIIKAAGGLDAAIFVGDHDEIVVSVSAPGKADPITLRFDVNHAEAFEVAIRGARLESEARSKDPSWYSK